MENFKCAFSGALIGKQYGCQFALEVTRREGPSIACTSAAMHEKCAALIVELKAAALPQFGYEDDLTQMPHSVLMKIQMGGLAGLQKQMLAVGKIDNIAHLVSDAEQRYGNFSGIPYANFVQEIVDFKVRRRR